MPKFMWSGHIHSKEQYAKEMGKRSWAIEKGTRGRRSERKREKKRFTIIKKKEEKRTNCRMHEWTAKYILTFNNFTSHTAQWSRHSSLTYAPLFTDNKMKCFFLILLFQLLWSHFVASTSELGIKIVSFPFHPAAMLFGISIRQHRWWLEHQRRSTLLSTYIMRF